jgi:NTP pyrophosphatase (non-canonical NTP hydrolase)
MIWNQQTIHAWGTKTFGDAAHNSLGLAIRMTKEAVELTEFLSADLSQQEIKKIHTEAADVAIVLLQVANAINFNVEKSLLVNHWKNIYDDQDDDISDEKLWNALPAKLAVDLVSAIFHNRSDMAKALIIRIMAVLSVIEEVYEFDLWKEIQEKMEINAARSWKKLADGSHQHV